MDDAPILFCAQRYQDGDYHASAYDINNAIDAAEGRCAVSDAPRTDAKKAAFCQIEMPRLLKLVWEWAENLEGEIREDMEMLNEELRTNATLRQQLAAVTAERDRLRNSLQLLHSASAARALKYARKLFTLPKNTKAIHTR